MGQIQNHDFIIERMSRNATLRVSEYCADVYEGNPADYYMVSMGGAVLAVFATLIVFKMSQQLCKRQPQTDESSAPSHEPAAPPSQVPRESPAVLTLTSSNCAKYAVGEHVNGLGENKNVSGVVISVEPDKTGDGGGIVKVDTKPNRNDDKKSVPPETISYMLPPDPQKEIGDAMTGRNFRCSWFSIWPHFHSKMARSYGNVR